MRYSQPKGGSKSNVGSSSVKPASNNQKPTTSTKRTISSSVRASRKRKFSNDSSNGKPVTQKNQKETDTEKTQKKYNPGVVKKSSVNVKRIKKPNEKFKKVPAKTEKKAKVAKKAVKKPKTADKRDDDEGPPTLCETFSRITTMVAETVINEKELTKLVENVLGKPKKEEKHKKDASGRDSSPGKSNAEASGKGKKEKEASEGSSKSRKDSPVRKANFVKKMKPMPVKNKASTPKATVKPKKISAAKVSVIKKSVTKATLDKSENLVKVLKDEEMSLVFGKGIGTRRKSVPCSPENEKEGEQKADTEKQKMASGGNASTSNLGKSSNVVKSSKESAEKQKPNKQVPKGNKGKMEKKEKTGARTTKEKKPKINESQVQIRKLVDEMRKSLDNDKDKDKDKEEGNQKEPTSKEPLKKSSKKEKPRTKASEKKSKSALVEEKIKKKPVKKVESKIPKSPKPKLGSETDGSNSDELTLNIIQKKTKKGKNDAEKAETSTKAVSEAKMKVENVEVEEVKVKIEEKLNDHEKSAVDKTVRAKKMKVEKEEKTNAGFDKKVLDGIAKEKRKSKDTESDTDEDLELRRLLAKKLAKNINVRGLKRKRLESGKTNHSDTEQRARRLKLFGFWSGPKRHRVASLNALAKVHCLYENESKGVMAEIEKMGQILKSDVKSDKKVDKKSDDKSNKSEKKNAVAKKAEKELDFEKLDSVVINKRTLRGAPGTRGAGKHWDMFAADSTTSTSGLSSDESHSDTDVCKGRRLPLQPSYRQKMQKKEESEKETKAPKRRRNNEIGLTMDLKDMVVRKRMASLNASAILAASYSSEKRSNRKDSSGTSTEDGLSSPDGSDDQVSTDESENAAGKKKNLDASDSSKDGKSSEKDKDDKGSEIEGDKGKRRKNFWKTKVENLKKASKEKRNSPSPILAEFGVERGPSDTVLEKERNDELNDDKQKVKKTGGKIGYITKKYAAECKSRAKAKEIEEKAKKRLKESDSKVKKDKSRKDKDDPRVKKKYSKRKMGDEEVKNINIEKMSRSGKSDEYEYKSDSDNGQRKLIELRNAGGSNKKVAVIVNQDTDVTITGVYVNSTRSTHHEGFCSIAGMQYRISSTSHTQTEATAVLKTSTASEQTPPPAEPTNCTSPRNHKSYTPLSALSSMQPPAGAPAHPHLPPPPPPPHHHHHHCGMSSHRPPPDHYMSHGPPQGPISPLGRRHGCTSAFSAPHCSTQPSSSDHGVRDGEPFPPPPPPLAAHGYFQPAGPLIHHHSSVPPGKGQNLTSIDSPSTTDPPPQSGSSEEPGESSRSGENPAPPPPPPPPTAGHHMGYARGYPPYQGGYYQGGYYPPPPQSSHYQTPPPSFHQHYHHHQDLCYPPGYPPSTYPPPPGSYRRFLQPPPGYYSSELTYSSSGPPPPSQDHGAQQMVVPGGPSSSYSAPLDPYPPPAPYYPGYSPGPGPACYSHTPPSRNLAFIEQTYQSCPCPMQSCPKNVHIGPLTGECKRPGALPLPPVALQLPQEPPGAAGPPSPARGSAGMPPLPSPVSNSARPNCSPAWDGRQTKPNGESMETKWDDSKTKLEITAQKYNKHEVLHTESKTIWNPTDPVKTVVKNTFLDLEIKDKANDSHWGVLIDDKKDKIPDSFPQSQGLLAISSTEIMKLPPRVQPEEEKESVVEESKIIKTETVTPPIGTIDLTKKPSPTPKKRKLISEDAQKNRKRKKSDGDSQISLENLEKINKAKRKLDSSDEDSENKVKKVKKGVSVKQKDENECVDRKVAKKNQKNVIKSKAKLLKDRNETVCKNGYCDTISEVIEQVIKGQTTRRKKKLEDEKLGSEKIINRRKSNLEKRTVPLPETQCVRKSKSCSPNRSKTRENSKSPIRLIRDDTKKKSEVSNKARNVKSKTESKSKTTEKSVNHEHSKATAKPIKKNCAVSKPKQVSILNRSSQQSNQSMVKSKKSKCDSPLSMLVLKKSISKKAISLSPKCGISPKWSNGWSWDGESFDAKVYLTNDEPPVLRKCYSAMRHVEGDVIQPKDCILLKAGPRKIDLPFVAKVAALWENPDDGEMMVSLLWYYRPEHTDQGRQPSDQQDEIFASRHKDINSVACIEDKCFVLTYNEYCRYRKKVRRVEESVEENKLLVPRLEQPYPRLHRQPPCVMAPDIVFFCRRVYDFRQKRLLKNPT